MSRTDIACLQVITSTMPSVYKCTHTLKMQWQSGSWSLLGALVCYNIIRANPSNESRCTLITHARRVIDAVEVITPIALGLLSSKEHRDGSDILQAKAAFSDLFQKYIELCHTMTPRAAKAPKAMIRFFALSHAPNACHGSTTNALCGDSNRISWPTELADHG